MARRHSAFGTLLTLGGVAAAGWAVYKNRDVIKGFLKELTAPGSSAEDTTWEAPEEEVHIVIDNTEPDDGDGTETETETP